MKLYRAISYGEYSTLKRGHFTAGLNSMEGKWFAESYEDAYRWGDMMTFDPSFIIVEIELLDDVADQLFRLEVLDGIGPARYPEIHQLADAIILGFKHVD